jgi:hypothetical protein
MTKEAIAINQAGYLVTVIFCPMSPWGDSFDKELFIKHPQINWICVGAHPKKNKIKYFYTRVRRNFWDLIYNAIGNHFNSALKSAVLYSQDLDHQALKHKADFFIGHNLGSINAVIKASQKFKAKAAFDFEDFHRGETRIYSKKYRKVKVVEDKFIPYLNCATAASPLISKAYKDIYPDLDIQTVNNCFNKSNGYDELLNLSPEKIKLFWFSQTVADGRGIDVVLKAMGLLRAIDFELTLLGNCSNESKNFFVSMARECGVNENQLIFLNPVSEDEIIKIAAEHHIGLAVEIIKEENRNLCLSNKVFTYLLSGCAIIYSNTQAQKEFFNENKELGFGFSVGDFIELSRVLQTYKNDYKLLNYHRNNSLNASKNWNWENESLKLISLINNQLN